MRSITVHDLKAALDAGGVQLVDVREPHEYAVGRVPGAVLVPMAGVPGRLDDLDRERPVLLVCAVGGRSGQVARWLDEQGFDTVNVEGGTSEWVAAGYPVER